MRNVISQDDLVAFEEDEAAENGRIFQKLVAKFFALWPWLIVSVMIGVALSYLYLSFTVPVYKIHGSVLVQDDKKGTDFAESQIMQDFGLLSGKSNVDNEAEIFKSRTLMEQVVNDLQLNVHYLVPGRLASHEIYLERPVTFRFINFTPDTVAKPGMYRFAFNKPDITSFTITPEGGTALKGRIGDTLHLPEGSAVVVPAAGYSSWPAESVMDLSIASPAATAQNYMGALSVDIPNKQVSVIYLSLVETIPYRGESILNDLTRVYLQANVDDKNRIADSTMDFIDKRLSIVSRELSGIEKDIEGFKTANKLTDLTEQSKQLLENTSEYTKQLTAQEVQLAVVDTLEHFLTSNINKTRIVPSTLVMQDANFISIVQRYNEMQLQRDRMLMSQTTSHPAVITMDEQLQNLRMEMLSSVASIKKGIAVSIAELKKRTNGFESMISKVPAKERVFLDISRQQSIKQELYLFLLKKREETAISKSSTLANARVIDSARSENYPFSPKKSTIAMMGFLIGLIIPFAISFAKDFLNTRISSLHDINSLTKVPVLGEIGHNTEMDVVAVSVKSRHLIAEQFRALRTNLQYLLPNENDKTVLVTSSMSGEGKSFLCINISITMALAGKRVLLLEMDLRKPKISSNLGLKKLGFTNYIISQDTNWQSWIQPSGIEENFHVLSSGPIPPNPTELLLLPKTKALFEDLKKHYDYIVIDSPPVGLVTDAEIMAQYANATLYMVRHQLTHKQQIKLVDKFFQKKSLPKLNIIINDAQTKKTGYGYGYSYGYGYGYGYGNYEEKAPGKKKKGPKIKTP